jgi:4-coumarate--CoA ligase
MAVILHVPVYVMKQFVFEEFLQNIQQFKITTLHVAPPVLVMLSKRPETAKYDLRTVTDVLCGAGPLPNEVWNDVSKRFKVQINNGWGMTEVTCGTMVVPGGVDDDSGSVGQLIPNTDCELRDDDGKVIGVGERGEIFVRGPQICMGYWRNEEVTRESLQDGWLKTGDVAVVDERGYFWIVDRKKVRLLAE